MKRFGLLVWALLIGLAAASPALAQDAAEDWDLAIDPAQELTLASLDFGDNVLALRCKAGVLDFLLTGTPVSTEAFRTIRILAPGIAEEVQVWRTQPGLPVVSASMPARLARLLRTGGDLDIRLEPAATGERGLRYRLPVPASAASLDQALSACGQPLADEWDSRPRFPMNARAWASQALPEYPDAAIQRDIPVATVELACVVAAEGRLSECRVLSENPEGLGFGRNALEAARRSRLNVPEDDTSSVGEIAQYVARFLGPAN